MKTLRFLFIGLLFFSFSIASVQAQTVKEIIEGPWERVMVECDGDYLFGTYDGIRLTHFDQNGNVDWIISEVKAEVVSASTGELFKVSQYTKYKINIPGETDYFTFHQNFVGNMGTNYQIAITFEIDPSGTWTPIKEKVHCW